MKFTLNHKQYLQKRVSHLKTILRSCLSKILYIEGRKVRKVRFENYFEWLFIQAVVFESREVKKSGKVFLWRDEWKIG